MQKTILNHLYPILTTNYNIINLQSYFLHQTHTMTCSEETSSIFNKKLSRILGLYSFTERQNHIFTFIMRVTQEYKEVQEEVTLWLKSTSLIQCFFIDCLFMYLHHSFSHPILKLNLLLYHSVNNINIKP